MRARVREAAITVALREGCHGATVEAITGEADVSARTFFNYFESKEFALVGVETGHIQAAAEHAVTAASAGLGASTARQVVDFLVDVLTRAVGASPSAKDRLEVIRQNPHLFEWQIGELSRAGDDLRPVVSVIASTQTREHISEEIADQILLTCLGAVAATGRAWLLNPRSTSPSELSANATQRVQGSSTFLAQRVQGADGSIRASVSSR
ncbi:TetR family transcriptional regulator [Subtercola boreus]|nr:TetR family transcriptional regulator [Subtercola boreus]